jgi:SAM-dependent methyltransferase
MNPALTLFTTCKPFAGPFATIQTNALRSWAALRPEAEILVFGDEPGVRERCETLGVRQVRDVPRNEFGTPLLDGLIAAAEREARGDTLALVNADILLTRELLPAVADVRRRFDRFLLLVRRWNVDLEGDWMLNGDDPEPLVRAVVRERGMMEPVYRNVDVFVFSRGLFAGLPPYAVGRGRWDSALIYEARRRGAAVVDATDVVTTAHQNHDYSHHPGGAAGLFEGPEYARNEALLGGPQYIFTALNATHVLTPGGLRRRVDLYPHHLLWKVANLPALHPRLAPVVPVVAAGASAWRGLQRLKSRVGRLRERVTGGRGGAERPAERLPYPISISPEPMPTALPPGGGVENFDTPEARALNEARLRHLASLGLPLERRRVLDVGCGVGHLARFFVERGCDVLCVDGRSQNVERLRELYPHLKARVLDIESDPVAELGRFDVVLAYGVLYHLENPFRALRTFASLTEDLLLIETMVADHHLPLVRLAEETSTYSQALRNVGSRPTPSFVVMVLRQAGFGHVYAPRTPPDHPDFRFEWRGDLADNRGGHLLRCVFIASRRPLENSLLVSLLPGG